MTFVAQRDWYCGTLGIGTRLGQDGWLVYASRLRRYQRLPPLVRNPQHSHLQHFTAGDLRQNMIECVHDQFPPHDHSGGDEDGEHDLFPNGHWLLSAYNKSTPAVPPAMAARRT